MNNNLSINGEDLILRSGARFYIIDALYLNAIRAGLNDLVDSLTENINTSYWGKITRGMKPNDIGLILAPGVNSGFEFEGGGIYKIGVHV